MTPTAPDYLAWGVLPYVVLTVLIGGTAWRYKYDRFGWTTRSSQLYESRLLRIASPVFHFGLLMVIGGHAVGLLIPASWTDAAGISEEQYHVVALSMGLLAGTATLFGIGLLIYRRITTGAVRGATTGNDKIMYLVLTSALVSGMAVTLLSAVTDDGVDYRQTVSVWFRSIWTLQPDVAAMSAASTDFKLHVVIGLALFALFPFSRLVHALSAPIGYLFRPYVVYRSRDRELTKTSRPIHRGWG